MNRDFETKLSHLAPAGLELGQELKWFTYGWVTCLLYSFGVLGRYVSSYNSLFFWDGLTNKLSSNAIMPDFGMILGGGLQGYAILALGMLAVGGYHYFYHYQGSKSIYLMKRLPDRWELTRRCLTLPLLGVLVCLISALVLLLIYFAIYMLFTPSTCLLPDQWQKLWSLILGVTK